MKRAMIEIIQGIFIAVDTTVIDGYMEWLQNILKYTGMSLGAIFLFLAIFWLVQNLLLVMLAEMIPMIKGILVILEFLLLPGTLMHLVWHVLAAKKMNIPSEHVGNMGYGWSRSGIRLVRDLASLREAMIFYYAPLMNIPVIIGWVMPGMLLFQWLDSLIENTVFYWIWLYILVSLVMFGLPDLADLVNPFQISIIKTPEFFVFVMFYIIIAPTTLIFWGWGITVIFSLIYAISTFYEVNTISKHEEKRLMKSFDKYFATTKTITKAPPKVLTDSE